eukprot:7450464-Pyramimonas_sp.AAC.1
MQHVLDSARWLSTPRERDRVIFAAHTWFMSLQWLASKAVAERVPLWKIRPKHHYLDHMIDRLAVDRQNPCRQLQCAGEEAYLGVLKRIGKACHGMT